MEHTQAIAYNHNSFHLITYKWLLQLQQIIDLAACMIILLAPYNIIHVLLTVLVLTVSFFAGNYCNSCIIINITVVM